MQRLLLSAITTLGMALLLLRPVEARGQGILLHEDFSVDPSWITDQPADYFWDAAGGFFHAVTDNAQPAASPTRYAYTLVNYEGQSIRLEFDLELSQLDLEAGVHFGLFDSSLRMSYDVHSSPDTKFLHVHPARDLNGDLILSLRVRGLNGIERVQHIGSNFYSERVWYHFVVTYNAALDVVALVVTQRDSGEFVGQATIGNIGGLPNNLDYLGFVRDPAGNCCTPVGSGCGEPAWCIGAAHANLDNVVLSELSPEIPALGDWGLVVFSLCILCAATLVFRLSSRRC